MPDRIAELYRLADLSTKIIVEEDGPFIHAMAYPTTIRAAADVCHLRRGHRSVKEQSGAFLEKARSFLAKAQDLLDAHHWPDEAGRAAYLSGLHGAQALIFERTGNIIKRHRGV